MNDTLLLAAVAAVCIGWGMFVFRLASRADTEGVWAMCTPARYESYTAQPAAAPRRIIAELAPPAGWRDVMHVAVVPAPAAQVDDFDDGDELDDIDDWDGDGDELPRGVPESVLIALLTGQPLPTPAVVEPDPVPVVVVNRTAARFASLEVRR